MGTVLEARVEVYEAADPPHFRGAWYCLSTWELGKNYGLMMWLDKTAIRGWPPDVEPFDDLDIVGGKQWLWADLLWLSTRREISDGDDLEREVIDEGVQRPSWLALVASVAPLVGDGERHGLLEPKYCRVLFHRD